ncbi:hypothetical protein [Acetivibrio mesophilus]|uniref:Uncharacterized protein n=1 Tax=Acetivibrio mesophilus TaxID=2487273 RepID=A0A4V1K2F8_9FIRM|nr:hypothetical protein [Acetivibrio mesophilus]ODM25555.1 hypothetical protein A7W90_04575 [Clostridium sp. Bc-iso-3]RXE60139.1 hypothetical protein EFD62_02600 [Acetivibrio mesophilus]HHV29104.1 hypothetical protein [Clostridium sp.]
MKKAIKKELMKKSIKRFLKDERGEFGVKQIAITVAVIVVVGLILTILQGGLLEGIVNQVWDFLWEQIQNLMG